MENQFKGDCLKRGLVQFTDLKGGWARKRGGVDTPMHATSSQNNLKVTTNYYEKKCLLVITKNKHSSKEVVPITYTLEKLVFAAATFQGL